MIREITAGQVLPARLDTHLLFYDLMSLYVYRNSATRKTIGKAIAGAGNAGSTYACAMLLSRLHSEVVLIDANRHKAIGEVGVAAACQR